jgi:hypothetical protein
MLSEEWARRFASTVPVKTSRGTARPERIGMLLDCQTEPVAARAFASAVAASIIHCGLAVYS